MSLRTYDIVSTFRRVVVNSITDEEFELCQERNPNEKVEEVEGEETGEEEKKVITVQEKIDVILKKKDRRYLIREMRKRWKVKKIRRSFYRFLSHPSQTKSCKIGTTSMLRSLSSLFFKDNEFLTNRNQENESLKRVNMSPHALFVKIKGVRIPCEIISQIISYVGHNRWALLKIGRINWTFYLIMLKYWPRIEVTPKNLYSISLLVLRNSEEVRILFDFQTCNRIRYFQCNYIYDQLQNVKKLDLEIGPHFDDFKRFLLHLTKRRQNSGRNYPFEYVTDLKLSGGCKLLLSKWEKEWERVCLKNLFPRARSLVGTPSLYILKNYESLLTKLTFSLELFKKNLDFFIHSKQIPFIPSSVTSLKIVNVDYMANSGNYFLDKFVELFEMVKNVCREINVMIVASGRDHSEVESDHGKVEVIKYFGFKSIREKVDHGDVMLKDKKIRKNPRGYFWNVQIVRRVRLVWKRQVK